MVDVLNDPSDETSERERRRIEKSDSESHSGRNPRGIPQPMSGGMRLECGDYGEQNRKGEHEDCAFLREATVTCTSGQQGHQRLLNLKAYEAILRGRAKRRPSVQEMWGRGFDTPYCRARKQLPSLE